MEEDIPEIKLNRSDKRKRIYGNANVFNKKELKLDFKI